MIIGIYKPPDSSSRSWVELRIGSLVNATDFEYDKKFCGVGTFEFVIPIGSRDVDKLALGQILISPDGGFIVKNIQNGADEITVSGYDLNGMLCDRLTVAKSEDGRDKIAGSTEYIVKHFVTANCTPSADTGRAFPGLSVKANQNRGLANDAASPRLEIVADVVSDILSAQQMGWRISAVNLSSVNTSTLFEFEVYESVKRTVGTARPKTFSYGFGNADSIKTERSIADAKNTLYCELSNGTVQTYSPVSDNVGFGRVEEYADLGCELSELSIYAEHEIAGRYAEAQSVTLDSIDASGFGDTSSPDGFDLGDIVTVVDNNAGITHEALITSVTIKRTGENPSEVAVGDSVHEISITVGESRAKPLDRVSQSVSTTAKSVGTTKAKVANIKEEVKTETLDYVLNAVVNDLSPDKLKSGSNELRFLPVTVQTVDEDGMYMETTTGRGARLDYYYLGATRYAWFVLSNLYAKMQDVDGKNYVLSLGEPEMQFYDAKRNMGFKEKDGKLQIFFGKLFSEPLTLQKMLNGDLWIEGVNNIYVNGRLVGGNTETSAADWTYEEDGIHISYNGHTKVIPWDN